MREVTISSLLSTIRPRGKLGWIFLALVSCFLGLSVVLHTCLENYDDEDLQFFRISAHQRWLALREVAERKPVSAAVRAGAAAVASVPREVAAKLDRRFRPNPSLTAVGRSSTPLSQRKAFEARYPPSDWSRTQAAVKSLRVSTSASFPSDLPYEVTDCPETPPPDYPMTWSLHREILPNWSVDETGLPNTTIYHGLCVFDWNTDRAKAFAYRQAELPFVLQNTPEVWRAAERWNHPRYLSELIGPVPLRNEHSRSNHLMWWKPPKVPPPKWTPPSDNVQLSYEQFREKALEMDRHVGDQAQREHWYFRLNGSPHLNQYLYEELPLFWPSEEGESTFFLVDPDAARGINCRLGMRGNLAELHLDGHRNFVAVLGGRRRYLLADPALECEHMELHPLSHPSGRHSSIDWSHPPPLDYQGPFAHARANEVVLQAGDVLYLPDSWLHLIVNLSISYQCNARSGRALTKETRRALKECGFGA